jgi:hypothetical protein
MIDAEHANVLINAPVAERQPVRAQIDMHIDDVLRYLVKAEQDKNRDAAANYARQLTALIQERNAQRTQAEVEALERERGIES